MYPAFSVIFFTVVSGCGFGVLFLAAAAVAIGWQSPDNPLALLAAGFAMAAAGLTASLLHLGQPQRAWRAFSQWRSSWLSREGVASVAALAATLLLIALLLVQGSAGVVRACAGAVALLGIVCVVCTAQIYATLRTVPAWHNAYVLPGYLLCALLGGVAWSWALAEISGAGAGYLAPRLLVLLAALAAGVHKHLYWRFIDRARAGSTPESATGLGRFGRVRSVEAPHTEENYLTREMGFALARKHARRLRRISLMLIGALPAILAALAAWMPATALDVVYAFATATSVTCGLFIERWLFFAEAKHVVMLYYGTQVHAQRA